jgi:glycosyltransferase involved in cell wall biosynthesis
MKRNKKVFANAVMPFEWLSNYLPYGTEEEAKIWVDGLKDSELFDAVYHNYPLGEWVKSSVHSHFRMRELDILDSKINKAYRSYLYSSVIALKGLNNLLENYRPDTLFLLNGRFFSHRIALELARERSVRVIVHERGRIDNSIVLMENTTVHSMEPLRKTWHEWKDIALNKNQIEEIEKVFIARGKGKNTGWKPFVAQGNDVSDIIERLQLSDKKQVITLFTSSEDECASSEGWEHIIDQFEWIQRTIDYFARRKDYQLVIRVHPNTSGITGSDVQSVEKINKIISAGLPDNVKIVKWDEKISSYQLIELSQACLTYWSTVSLEASARGKPVMVCARGILYGYPFALNLPDANEFERYLDKLLAERLSIGRMRTAYRFGYHYFIRWSIPFPLVSVIKVHNAKLNYTTTTQLLPGRDKSLDRICDFILLNKPVYPAPEQGDVNSLAEEDEFLGEKRLKIKKSYDELQEKAKHPIHKPTVSVIVPCYNYACYLPEAVESVLNQTYQDFEIIIVNDGSPDDTKEVAEKLIAEHPQHQIRLINQANSGQPAIARNNGIAEAKGEYILPLDADDKLAPQAIELCLRAAKDYPGQPVVVYGWMKRFGVEETVWKTKPFSPHQLLHRDKLPYCSMYHRSVWEFQNGYSANVPGYEDWDFWVGAAKMGAKFINLPLVTTFYRRTGEASLVDSARKKHEWLVAGMVSNHSDIFEDEEVAWAADYLERFPEPPKQRPIHGSNDRFPKISAVLIVSYPEWYTPEEIAWAKQFLNKNPFKIVKGIKPGPANVDASCEPEGMLAGYSRGPALEYFLKARREFDKGNFGTAIKHVQKYRTLMDYSKLPRVLNTAKENDNVAISVIIVTCNRTDELKKCLESLSKQDSRGHEVIVVDNGQGDVNSCSQYINQYVKCPVNFNLSEGRNIGAYFARGVIVVFLDDDALVASNYISSIKSAFDKFDIFGLRGRAYPKGGADADNRVKIYNLGDRPFPSYCNQEGNSAFILEVYKSVGGMDPLLFGHEGNDLTYRIIKEYKHPNKVIYWPEAIIYHDYGTEDKFGQKQSRYQQDAAYLKYKHGTDILVNKRDVEKYPLPLKQNQTLPGKVSSAQVGLLSESESAGTVSAVSANRPHPKVSVIASCYNAEKFLPECIDSIRNQTMQDWELFVLDDASTDGTKSIIEKYARMDERIRPYYFHDNKGPYVRRNFAIERANSDFIVIQDADDIMRPAKLETLYNEITTDERLGIVGSFYHSFLDEFKELQYAEKKEFPLEHNEIIGKLGMWQAGIWHGSAIIRKELFQSIGLYDENPFGADSFWLAKVAEYARCTADVKLKNAPEFLTLRRMHSGSQTQIIPNRIEKLYMLRFHREIQSSFCSMGG